MERDIDQLLLQLESLRKKQGEFAQEIDRLQAAIDALRSQSKGDPQITPPAAVPGWSSPKPIRRSAATHSDEPLLNFAPLETKWDDVQRTPAAEEVTGRSNLEKYIGENILSKLGIAITVIGVAVGAKYAIDHDMVTPLGRLIGGYSFGVVLSVMAWRLKMKYENFSAVLLSGAMAIFYFITYLGCTQYGLIPVVPAFALMVLFTIAAVMSSLLYNRQVIAHFGLVGAYAVPFLLSTKSSNVEVLFTYMALINTGILFIALKKQWISLNVSAFIFTWSIYFFWLNLEFYRDKFLWTALGFSTLFVLFFYAMFLVDKWKRKATNNVYDTIVIVINSGVFYLFGLYAIGDSDSNRHLLSSFHLFNAGIQWGLYRLLARRQDPAADIYPGLSVLFVAIAVPIEFDGYMVTLLWTIMSGLLFFAGRRCRMFSVELLSYPMLLVSFVSLLHDLQLAASAYFPSDPSSRVSIFLHKEFYVALFYVFAVFFITYHHSKQWRRKETKQGNQAVFTLL
ncbi:MAG: DUF2339 domain-containing protein, partial [Flavobacteriales bacterium]|nr:DUF2339 domain-containing protein [Flavobacteriales bacterium]